MNDIHRLTIFRSSNHIYAQLMLSNGSGVLASASTRESSIKEKKNGNINAAAKVGKRIAERALEKGIQKVALDRAG